MTFARRAPSVPARRTREIAGRLLAGAGACLSLMLVGCSTPPQPVPEPTGEDLERAWRVAVGDDALDQTVAQIYAMAMNSHEMPTVVVDTEEETVVELAVRLSAGLSEPEAGSEPTGEGEDGSSAEPEEGLDDRYELVVARTMPLAEALGPEEYARLTEPDDHDEFGPAAEPDDVAALVEAQLSQAELLTPTTAVLDSGLITTSIAAETYDLDPEDESAFEEIGQHCDELSIGVTPALSEAAPLLSDTYGCVPEEIYTESEDELIELLITAEIDAALMTTSHPDVDEHALVTVADARRAFPQDQYAPVVSSRIADEVPDVVEDISLALDDQALLTLRRLVHGEDGLQPEDAAIYWLVDEGLLAEPEDWG